MAQILEALHFPVRSIRQPGFGKLPITCLASAISTVRPPDEVIIENTEISGMDAFEEIVNLDDIRNLRDPLKERLIELVKSQGQEFASGMQ